MTRILCFLFGHKPKRHSILGLWCSRCTEILGLFAPERFWR